MKHLLSIQDLDKSTIAALLAQATQFKQHDLRTFSNELLKGRVIAKLFFEASTRTRNSFEIAAYRLGAFVINPDMQQSALTKGETFLDTLKTIEAMGVSLAVIRHAEDGVLQKMAEQCQHMAIVNAGDGTHQHPTQALIDLLTIAQHKKSWADLTVSVIGDVRYSRVARSLIHGLQIMGTQDIRLIAPIELMPTTPFAPNLKQFDSLAEGLANADVVVCLRLQKERMPTSANFNVAAFKQKFRLTEKMLTLAKPDAIVLHPGPINRDIEIACAVADGAQSVILQQVANGIAMRMSVLQFCLSP